MMAMTQNTITGGTSPKLKIKPCPSTKFLQYTTVISTVGIRINTMLYKYSIGFRSPFPSSHAPVTKAGNDDFVLLQTLNGPLSLWVGASESNSIEFRVNDMDGGVKSSSSGSVSASTARKYILTIRSWFVPKISVAALIAWKDVTVQHMQKNARMIDFILHVCFAIAFAFLFLKMLSSVTAATLDNNRIVWDYYYFVKLSSYICRYIPISYLRHLSQIITNITCLISFSDFCFLWPLI